MAVTRGLDPFLDCLCSLQNKVASVGALMSYARLVRICVSVLSVLFPLSLCACVCCMCCCATV